LRLLCIGDVALGNDNLSEWDPLPPGELTPGKDEKILFNWELPIGTTVNSIPRSSGPRLLAHPSSPRVIKRWSPGIATLATNHILDAGEEGLVATIGSLNQAGFMTVGAGRTLEEIARPLFWETSQGRLAIVNWVFPETHPDWMYAPGANCWPGTERAANLIQELRSQADWVMVVAHWSDEFFPYPRPEDRVVARQLSEMGVDLVIGHHPHVVRGMEIIGSCPVFYSVGNFYFSDFADGNGGTIGAPAPRNRQGLGVRISFKQGQRPKYKALSFLQKGSQVIVDPLNRATRIASRVSRPLSRFDDPKYNRWYTVRRGHFDRWSGRWHFGVRRLGMWGTTRRIFQLVFACLRRFG